MLRERIREGARAGVIAGAATAGALIALGRAHGAALRPLNAVAHILIGSRAYYIEGLSWITAVALAAHLLSVIAWGATLSVLASRARGAVLYATALLFAGATWLLDYRIVPDRLRPGFESGLSTAEIGLVYLVLGVGLAWGLDRERDHG